MLACLFDVGLVLENGKLPFLKKVELGRLVDDYTEK